MLSDKEYEALVEDIKGIIAGGYTVFLLEQGFGEISLFAKLLYKYKELYNKKVCLFVKRRILLSILECCPWIDDVMYIEPELYDKLASNGYLRLYCRVRDVSMYHFIVGISKDTAKTEICDYLALPFDTKLKDYEIPEVEYDWESFFHENKIKMGKTVYIVPHANFLRNTVPDNFWSILVNRLQKEGFTTLINSNKIIVDDVPHVFFDMDISLTLAKKCGFVVGTRTGFMDIIGAFSKVPIVAIYPDDSHPSWDGCSWTCNVQKDRALSYMHGWGIRNMFDRDNVDELVYNNTDDIINRIIEKLNDYN